MKTFLRTSVLILVVLLQLPGISLAKQVYLRDGSILECESFRKGAKTIVVKVNRDVVVEFGPGEVDLKRTFRKPKPHPARPQPSAADPASPAATSTGGAAQGAPAAAQDYGKDTDRPSTATTHAAKPAGAKPAAAAAHPATPAPSSAPTPAPASGSAGKPGSISGSAPGSAPDPVQAPAAKEAAPPEPAPAAAPEPGPVTDKAELQRRARENTEMMAEAIKKSDPVLLKKAIEAQNALVQQQKGAPAPSPNGRPEPPWFKYLLIMAASGLLIIVALWVVFRKAGEAGWKCLIPFYNLYILMQISGKPGWWFILLFVPVVGLAINLLAMLSLAEKFGRSALFGIGLLLLPMCFFPLLAFGGSRYGGSLNGAQEEMNFTFSEEPPQA